MSGEWSGPPPAGRVVASRTQLTIAQVCDELNVSRSTVSLVAMQGRVVTETTFDVKVWATEKWAGKHVTTYRVIWKVGRKRWKVGHRTAAAAESFRSELLTALRRGEALDVQTGRPVSVVRRDSPDVSWYDFACEYVDLKWPSSSPNHRMGTANVLMSVTTALMADSMPAHKEAAQAVRPALINWAFNARRGSEDQPESVTQQLDWVARNSPALADLTKPKVMRSVLASFETRLDGKRAAGELRPGGDRCSRQR